MTQTFDLEETVELRPRRVDRLRSKRFPADIGLNEAIQEMLDWHRLLREAAAQHGITWHIDIGSATTERADLDGPAVRARLKRLLDECAHAGLIQDQRP